MGLTGSRGSKTPQRLSILGMYRFGGLAKASERAPHSQVLGYWCRLGRKEGREGGDAAEEEDGRGRTVLLLAHKWMPTR